MDDREFGEWFSALVDERGSFLITNSNYARTIRCWFVLSAVPERMEIVETLQGRLGGLVRRKATDRREFRWEAASIDDLREIVAVLDRYPLRGQRAAEYAIWREAVAFKAATKHKHKVDQSPLVALHAELVKVRRDKRGARECFMCAAGEPHEVHSPTVPVSVQPEPLPARGWRARLRYWGDCVISALTRLVVFGRTSRT